MQDYRNSTIPKLEKLYKSIKKNKKHSCLKKASYLELTTSRGYFLLHVAKESSRTRLCKNEIKWSF